jgi:hypothetical protein
MTVKKLRYGRAVTVRCRVLAFWLDEKCLRAIWLVEKISSMLCRDRAVRRDFSHSLRQSMSTRTCNAVPCLIVPYRALSWRTVPYRDVILWRFLASVNVNTYVPCRALSWRTVPYRAVPYRAVTLACQSNAIRWDSARAPCDCLTIACRNTWTLVLFCFVVFETFRAVTAPWTWAYR